MKGSTRGSDATIGLDLGERRSHAVVLDAAGEEIEDRSIATSSLQAVVGALPRAVCRAHAASAAASLAALPVGVVAAIALQPLALVGGAVPCGIVAGEPRGDGPTNGARVLVPHPVGQPDAALRKAWPTGQPIPTQSTSMPPSRARRSISSPACCCRCRML